jgi:hypothetical protein
MAKTSSTSNRIYFVGGIAFLFLGLFSFVGLGIAGAAFTGSGGGETDSNTTAVTGGASFASCDVNSKFFQGLPGATLGSNNVPKQFIPFYEDSAAKAGLGGCGAAILAATHGIECNYGGNGACSSAHDGGVLGPMQFQQATWDGEIANRQTRRNCQASSQDILNVQKAICVAAFHDKHNGAPKNWRDALWLYNHADWYVDGVLARAKEIVRTQK